MTTWKVTYIFKAEDKLTQRQHTDQPTYERLLEWISTEKEQIERIHELSNINAFIKIQSNNPGKPCKYLKLSNPAIRQSHICNNNIIVQFFHAKKQQEVRSIIRNIGKKLDTRERELKDLNDELKDQFNQLRALEIISQAFKRNTSEEEKTIEVALVVSDPLVDETGQLPIFQDEVDISTHVQRLKRASLSNFSLSIQVKRYWGNMEEILNLKAKKGDNHHHILIMQFFTRVARINGQLMIQLEKGVGKRDWQAFQVVFADSKLDLLIVIGVGAYLLKEANYTKSLILISTCSMEQRRPIFARVNEFQNQYSYNDIYSQVFLQKFFQNIFSRMEIERSIREAHEEAREHLVYYNGCCCLHEHIEGCNWQTIVSKIGQLEAHRLFKHRYNEWNLNNNFPITFQLQKFLLGNEKVCAAEGPCCKLERRITYHRQNLSNLLIWNIKNQFAIQSSSLQGINKFFQSESYYKPSGRKRPLTIYKLIQQLIRNDITIMKSPILSLAKRYLSFAKQYLQVRRVNSHFHEVQIPNEMKQMQFKKSIEDILRSIQNRENIILYIQILHNEKKSDNFYDRLLQEHSRLTRHLISVFECRIQLKYIFLTCDPNFNDHYASYRIDDPLPPERYHYFLSKYSYGYISTHLNEVFQQITNGDQSNRQTINQYCENVRENNQTVYLFLGFLAQFSEDGFYLTKSGRVILEQIFNESTLTEVINNKLPLELISLSDSIFLQMLKPYQQHFKSKDNYYLPLFNRKRLEYYYILLRVYCQMLPESRQKSSNNSLRYIYHKEGLFSIDIEADEENIYDEIVDICKQNISQYGDINEVLYIHNNFRHKYHINQIEKILQQALKKKRSRLIGSKSALRQEEPKVFTYLLWNIALKSWAMCKTIEDSIQENVSHFQKAEASSSLAEIGRLQLYVSMGKQAPKPQDGINFGFMTEMLSYLRNYANRQLVLSTLQFEWGNTNKFKDLLGNCFNFAQKIRDMLTPDSEDQDYQKTKYFIETISYYKMYNNFNSTQWNRELLKLSERKVLYYFYFTKMLKSIHNLNNKEEKKKEFHREFKLRQIAYEFRALRKKLNQNQRKQEHRVLIDLYLGLLMNQSQANGTVLNTIKGKIKHQYMPIFNHLCQKIQQKALFNQNGLIICARARTIILDGKPCLFTRKRNLTMVYLKKLIEGKKLKISYFTLTPGTLNNLSVDQSNNRCEMLYLILTVDAPSADYLLFGSQFGIQGQRIHIKVFANQLKNCKIKILILCGQNSSEVCKQLQKIYRDWPNIIAPVMIGLSSNVYCLRDTPFNQYKSQKYPPGKRVWKYLSNEVNQIAMDLLIIAIVANINKSINQEDYTFTHKNLTEKVTNSHRLVKKVLNCRFTCANQVLDHISFLVFFPQTNPHLIINQIPAGKYQDLTTIFYSSQNNLFDEKYYENVGRNIQVNKIITAITNEDQRLVEVIGNKGTGKSTILQQVCWICQTKSLFKFGIWKFDLRKDIGQMKQFFQSRQFKNISRTNVENEVLIVLDNVNQQFLSNYQQYKPLLSKLVGKEITLIYSTNQPEVAPALQKIIQIKNPFVVNVNHITQDQIYGLMVSHIKQSPATIYTQEVAASFQEKVCQTMEKVKQVEEGNRLSLALSLLKGSYSLNESDTHDNFYNFYNQHFETLKKYLHNYREIQIHFT